MLVRRHFHVLGTLVLACLATWMLSGNAEARKRHYNPPSASFVMDANTGNILYARNADAPRHPASLTKVMTLYLLFEKLRDHKVSLYSRIPISWHAANQAPSRLGLNPGDTISVEDAILAIVTRSANDVAVAVAEYLGGTEKKFARNMTAEARTLGMKHTKYVNASGLPNKAQVTSARDQAILAKHIQNDFPEYFPYFSTEEFAWDGNRIRNHNHLLGKYEGVTGLKTGYTAASGFNLTTTVTRDNKSLIGVVLGGKTAKARDKEMMHLLNRTLPMAEGCCDSEGLSRTASDK